MDGVRPLQPGGLEDPEGSVAMGGKRFGETEDLDPLTGGDVGDGLPSCSPPSAQLRLLLLPDRELISIDVRLDWAGAVA